MTGLDPLAMTAGLVEPNRGAAVPIALRQVNVTATAAAATIKTAIAAERTVMQVASLATNQSRRALKACLRTGKAGSAGRESSDIRWLSSTQAPRKRPPTPRPFEPSGLARLFCGAGQERGHEHDESSR